MIRRLYYADIIPKLIAFGRRKHEELGFQFPFSADKCEKLLLAAMVPHSPDWAVWGAFDGKRVCGVLIGAIEPFAFMEGNYVHDAIFVADKHGEKLYRAMVQWGKAHGAIAVQMAVTSSAQGAGQFYERNGLRRVGGVYIKALA